MLQPAASRTAPRNPKLSPALSSLREGRTCSTAGSPGELQSGLGAVAAAVGAGVAPRSAEPEGAGAATGVDAGAVAVAVTTRDSDPARRTSAKRELSWARKRIASTKRRARRPPLRPARASGQRIRPHGGDRRRQRNGILLLAPGASHDVVPVAAAKPVEQTEQRENKADRNLAEEQREHDHADIILPE